jgi:hypothetical protein
MRHSEDDSEIASKTLFLLSKAQSMTTASCLRNYVSKGNSNEGTEMAFLLAIN